MKYVISLIVLFFVGCVPYDFQEEDVILAGNHRCHVTATFGRVCLEHQRHYGDATIDSVLTDAEKAEYDATLLNIQNELFGLSSEHKKQLAFQILFDISWEQYRWSGDTLILD